MNWSLLVQALGPLFGVGGVISTLVLWRKYRAEVAKTTADTGKISADTINALLTGVRDATKGFNEQINSLHEQIRTLRKQGEDEREKWAAERELEHAVWKEQRLKLEAENAELRLALRADAHEKKAIKDSLEAITVQCMVFSSVPDQLKALQLAVQKWEQTASPSKDPVLAPEGGAA